MTEMFAANTAMRTELYLNGYSFEEYLDYLRHCYPELYDLLSP